MKQKQENKLCGPCSKVDLYSLFTGPRHKPGFEHSAATEAQINADVGTLQEVLENSTCPLCRLIQHNLVGRHGAGPKLWPGGKYHDASRVQCYLRAYRADTGQDSVYLREETQERVATVVQVCLRGVEGCSKEEADLIKTYNTRFDCDCRIQLLSPDSVDPSRPLLNGFQATTMTRSLELLSGWVRACRECHHDTCGPSNWHQQPRLSSIRLIDVHSRALVTRDPNAVQYIALSYVWGQHTQEYLQLANEIQYDALGSPFLPSTAPGIIEDAVEVCIKLASNYLWVDLYCVQQNDEVQKKRDIEDMGLIYQNALVTLVAGGARTNPNNRLLPADLDKAMYPRQLVEEIQGRKYITAVIPVLLQMEHSQWNDRGWTYQEGALSRRIAFFGGVDVSFQCGAGHWRESLHSGPYGHDARNLASLSGLDLRSQSLFTQSAHNWLNNSQWEFEDYEAMLSTYSTRQLSYESDKINAVLGCLNMLARRKNVSFVWGLPTVDFHYALLWDGAYDRPRPGFPSWSWAGWHARRNFYQFLPISGSSGGLTNDGAGKSTITTGSTAELLLWGYFKLYRLIDMRKSAACLQTVCDLEVQEATLVIRSETAHFRFEVSNDASGTDNGMPASEDSNDPRFSVAPHREADIEDDSETDMSSILQRISITNTAGNVCRFARQFFPKDLRSSTLTWLQREGFDLVRILELKRLKDKEGTSPFHYIFCLGVNRNEACPGHGTRMGWYILSAEEWARANPKMESIKIM